MRRYFFDQREGDEMIPDEQGIDLVSLEVMHHEATLALAHLAKDEVRRCTIDAPARHRSYGRRSPSRLDVSSEALYPPLARCEGHRAITVIKSRRNSGATTGGTIKST